MQQTRHDKEGLCKIQCLIKPVNTKKQKNKKQIEKKRKHQRKPRGIKIEPSVALQSTPHQKGAITG